MKKAFKSGYVVNTAVLAAVYVLCVLLTSLIGDEGSFRLTVVPSIWQCCYLIILAARPFWPANGRLLMTLTMMRPKPSVIMAR